MSNSKNQPIYKKWYLWAIVALIVAVSVVVIVLAMNNDSGQVNDTDNVTETRTENPEERRVALYSLWLTTVETYLLSTQDYKDSISFGIESSDELDDKSLLPIGQECMKSVSDSSMGKLDDAVSLQERIDETSSVQELEESLDALESIIKSIDDATFKMNECTKPVKDDAAARRARLGF